MDKGSGNERAPVGTRERGMWRLMLKLPSIRGRLQILATKPSSLGNLFEAYDDACSTLDRLRSESTGDRSPMIEEYTGICAEIESEVIQYCLERGSSVPK
ncbi:MULTISPECIES: hypothetical protein [unclassified Rhizobium]|uniref:hypothetical protein n=1 Tax=unclassified Rhizobium TaxID=2613769 RepID=UPI000CDF3DF5|nr:MULTISPECIES: hypothetical protein [Rhizobium]AVA26440.1 hypothetical protein NXC24_PC02014 [Rhizobium sp. NXC24]UWU24085.1 hypothetical protein N2601_28030 [Rhizobium tropici]